MSEPITKIAFRWWDGEVVAIMPEDPATGPYDCTCYIHNGQHGKCDPQLAIRESRPASVEEYGALKRELESIGYKIRVIQRVNRQAYQTARSNEIARIDKAYCDAVAREGSAGHA